MILEPKTTLSAKIGRRAALYGARKPHTIAGHPMVSLTFDDVSQTACHEGRQIVESVGGKATYYVSGGFTDRVRSLNNHTVADLELVRDNGHELACHGYDHIDYQGSAYGDRATDMLRNREFLAQIIGDTSQLNFAYPYGSSSVAAKREIGRKYRSGRGVLGKLNVGNVDLNMLHCYELYESQWTKESVDALVKNAYEQGGWLIVFTHHVTSNPDWMSTSPSFLNYFMTTATGAGLQPVTIEEGLDTIGAPRLP